MPRSEMSLSLLTNNSRWFFVNSKLMLPSSPITSNNLIMCAMHGGSVPSHVVINQDRAAAEQRLYNDYFSDTPIYNEAIFKWRTNIPSPILANYGGRLNT